VLLIDPARPATGEVFTQKFRLADARKGIKGFYSVRTHRAWPWHDAPRESSVPPSGVNPEEQRLRSRC